MFFFPYLIIIKFSYHKQIRLGLDPKTFTDIVNASTGRCWSSECNHPVPGISDKVPANNDYQGGFSSALIAKVRKKFNIQSIWFE